MSIPKQPLTFSDHSCYRHFLPGEVASRLVDSNISQEEIISISEDLFLENSGKHSPWDAWTEDQYGVNQNLRKLLVVSSTLPTYTINIIFLNIHSLLINSYQTEWHVGTWKRLLEQENISSEKLSEEARWIIGNVGKGVTPRTLPGERLMKNKLALFSRTGLLKLILDHPNFPVETITELCQHKDAEIRECASGHPKCPPAGRVAEVMLRKK